MADKQLYKGSLTTIILKLLSENGRMYGYEITHHVKKMTGGEFEITEGALYPALHKLEAQGLLTPEYEQVKGRKRKYYTLTPKGKKEMTSKLEELAQFIQHMQLILNPKTSWPWNVVVFLSGLCPTGRFIWSFQDELEAH